jgi:hypothetical protein
MASAKKPAPKAAKPKGRSHDPYKEADEKFAASKAFHALGKPGAKKGTEKPQAAAPARGARTGVDKDAVERDYRTTQMTLRELAAKHGCTHALIAKWAKVSGWTRDLQPAVKAATAALLMKEAVTTAVTTGTQEVTNGVLAAAELNKQVILGHRADISKMRRLVIDTLHEIELITHSPEDIQALAKMATEGMTPETVLAVRQSLNDLMRLHSRVGSIHKLADAAKKLQEMERTAFHIVGPVDDDKRDQKPPPGVGDDPGDVYRWLANQRA